MAGIESLRCRFDEARSWVEVTLTIAGTQRALAEDLPGPLLEFQRQHRHVQVRLRELGGQQIEAVVECGEADLGLTLERGPHPPNPRLAFEPAYELDPILVTPEDHPLARRRRVSPGDLGRYPLINGRAEGFGDPAISATLVKLDAYRARPRRVEASYAAVVRRYVELGFGIGLVLGLPSCTPSPGLHERSLSRDLGRVTVYQVSRRGAGPPDSAQAQARTIKHLLGRA